MPNIAGRTKMQGHLAARVIRAHPTMRSRIADALAAMFRRFLR